MRAIQALAPRVRLSAVASGNSETAGLVECPVFPHWRDLLGAGLCDALVVTTPPSTHAEITVAALGQGLPVFVEKPLTLRRDEALAIKAAAIATGLPVMVDHVHLFSPAFRHLLTLVCRCGPVRTISGQAGKPGATRADASVLWDWGAHDVAMCLAVMDQSPHAVSARIAERPAYADGMGEIVELELAFSSAIASFRLGCLPERLRRFQVECDGGMVVYDDLSASKLCVNGVPVAIEAAQPLTVALSEFCHSVRDGRQDMQALELAVNTVDILARAEAGLR
ncbi:Gfo/Idh/MocA family protein [Magnetospirillum gryphiswaldense]|uniref:Gfo/Idh/MocA family protein n=1 Tax=Magnetospirillum gryphiswaldense TaxID=55518 RepID=UPI001F420A61|nr:Gfo/Idh/MocA family oxidoreductase [Magnetospirillum gryphiswaldense]